MRKSKTILKIILLSLLMISALYVPALALEESEVEAAVAASSKEAVTGNVLIWFLCAVAFLMAGRHITNSAVKTATSQTSAIHTAHTQAGAAVHTATDTQSASEARTSSVVQSDGAVHTESISRTDSATKQDGVIITGHSTPPTTPPQTGSVPPSGSTSTDEGIIITGNNTPPMPSTQPGSIPTPESGLHSETTTPQEEPVLTSSEIHSGSEHIFQSSSEKSYAETVQQGGSASEHHTVNQTRSLENTQRSTHSVFPVRMPTLGGKIFSNSLQSGGQFANDVIGMVARGDMRSTGSITGDLAAQSLQSYMGHTAIGSGNTEKVSYSQVEIGGGRITGLEVTPEHPQGIEFAMYHAGQYARPEGSYQKVFSADGEAWYKQRAVDSVAKTPYKAPDGEIAYNQEIVKRLPTPPKRKDRM